MKNFKDRVNYLVQLIPEGKVLTYGQIALFAGKPDAARQVGGLAHFGNPLLPWHRVVNYKGGVALGYPGGRLAHSKILEAEGVVFKDSLKMFLDLDKYLFKVDQAQLKWRL